MPTCLFLTVFKVLLTFQMKTETPEDPTEVTSSNLKVKHFNCRVHDQLAWEKYVRVLESTHTYSYN